MHTHLSPWALTECAAEYALSGRVRLLGQSGELAMLLVMVVYSESQQVECTQLKGHML